MPDPAPRQVSVGLDVGGTKVLACAVARSGNGWPEVLHERSAPSEPALGTRHLLEVVVGLAGDVRAEYCPDSERLGVGVAGYLGSDGILVHSPNVPALEGLDLASELSRRLGVEAVLENDANCVALATLAARRPAPRDLVAVTLGTGIGGAVVMQGELVRGAHGFAGEPGHMVVDPGGIPCVCGQRGCWERYASGSALARCASEAYGTAEKLVEAARGGEPAARELVDEFTRWVALGMSNLVNLLDPSVVVLGGGLSEAFDVMAGGLRSALEDNPTVAHRVPSLEAAPYGAAAGAVGAAALAAGWI